MDKTVIKIGEKTYSVRIVRTPEERAVGLSNADFLPDNEGMLFEYPNVQESVQYTMEDTSIPLDIIFIDEYGEVIKKTSAKKFSKTPIEAEDVLYVLEVNINSGINIGDTIEEVDSEEEDKEDEDFSDEEKEVLSGNKMLVLDSNGDVQYKLEGGERIFSRIMTRKMIKQALTAYKLDTDEEYKKLGKLVFKELQAQDSREAEYVELEN